MYISCFLSGANNLDPRLRGDDKPFNIVTPAQAGVQSFNIIIINAQKKPETLNASSAMRISGLEKITDQVAYILFRLIDPHRWYYDMVNAFFLVQQAQAVFKGGAHFFTERSYGFLIQGMLFQYPVDCFVAERNMNTAFC